MAKILMIVGSLRSGSFNRQLAEEIKAIIGDRAEVSTLEYAALPYMNQDIEFPTPPEVSRVRGEVMAADGVWICTPEYNGSFPGVLKNLLDWLSRPMDANDRKSPSAAAGKRVTISGAAGKSAAAGARAALRALLGAMRMEVIGGDGTGVVLGAEAFAGGMVSFTEADRAALQAQADEFLANLPVHLGEFDSDGARVVHGNQFTLPPGRLHINQFSYVDRVDGFLPAVLKKRFRNLRLTLLFSFIIFLIQLLTMLLMLGGFAVLKRFGLLTVEVAGRFPFSYIVFVSIGSPRHGASPTSVPLTSTHHHLFSTNTSFH